MLHVLCMTPSSIPIFTVGRDNITKCVCVCVFVHVHANLCTKFIVVL